VSLICRLLDAELEEVLLIGLPERLGEEIKLMPESPGVFRTQRGSAAAWRRWNGSIAGHSRALPGIARSGPEKVFCTGFRVVLEETSLVGGS